MGDTRYNYDADGNLVQKTNAALSSTFEYNSENRRVTAITNALHESYRYDAFGLRAGSTANGVITDYQVDPFGFANIVSTYSGSENHQTNFIHGLGLASEVIASDTSLYFDFDANGDAASLTGATGAVVNSYSYLPFGEIFSSIEAIPNAFQFIGIFNVISDNGLLSMGQRYYDPETGSFSSSDPIGVRSDSLNWYSYVNNAPVDYEDPSGENPAIEAVLIGIVVAVTAIVVAKAYKKYAAPYIKEHLQLNKIYQQFKDLVLERDAHSAEFPTPIGPINGIKAGLTAAVTSTDPNAKYGPSGYGPEGYLDPSTIFPYRIDFENDATATAPAQRVDITDQLNANLDWNSFEWTGAGFGDTHISIPSGLQYYQTTVSMTYNDKTFDVLVTLDLELETGKVHASFQSIDPNTSLPPDVLTGFLPPENDTGRGQGYISYLIKPKTDLATGTQIRNIALVQFDLGEIIATNQVSPHDPTQGTDPAKETLVTIDAGGPTSSVTALQSITNSSSFNVTWSGSDDANGSGIASYDIYVKDGSGDYTLWLDNTTLTTSQYPGAFGHTYAFYSVATDNVGHVELAPVTPDTTTSTQVPSNHAPQILDAVFTLTENSASSTPVGTVSASDPDSGDTLNFSIIGGNSATAFAINPATGALTVANSAALDFETTPSFALSVQVADNHGATKTATVTVNLTDVDESLHLNLNGSDVTYINKQSPISLLPQATVTGAGSLAGGTLTVTLNSPGKKKPYDVLTPPRSADIGSLGTPVFANGKLTLTVQLNGSATNAGIQAFLRGLTFITKGGGLKVLTRTLGVTLTAGGKTSSLSQTIHVRKK